MIKNLPSPLFLFLISLLGTLSFGQNSPCNEDAIKWVSSNIEVDSKKGVKLIAPTKTQYEIPINLPAAFKDSVIISIPEAISWDGYTGRASSNSQPHEQWKLVFFKDDEIQFESPYTKDLPTNTEIAEWRGALSKDVLLPLGADRIVLVHIEDFMYGAGSSATPNAVYPLSFCVNYKSTEEENVDDLVNQIIKRQQEKSEQPIMFEAYKVEYIYVYNGVNFVQSPYIKMDVHQFQSEEQMLGLVDRRDKIIADPSYDFIGDFIEGIAVFKIEDKFGFIKMNGERLTEAVYVEAADFSEGFAKVKGKKGYGYIDKLGAEIIPTMFAWASDFYGDAAEVETFNGKRYMLYTEFHQDFNFEEKLK